MKTDIDYQVEVSTAVQQPDWDNFVTEVSGGHHAQTSWWAQAKAQRGIRAVRVIIRQEGEIVAGGQILISSLPVIGTLGYVPKGPILAVNDSKLAQCLIDQLHRLARYYHLHYLVVQPHEDHDGLAHYLLKGGFRPSSVEVSPTATVQVDLKLDLDQILAGMKKKTRKYIRRGLRAGLVGRSGTAEDLAVFHQLLLATGQRQGFTPFPKSYFAEMWSLLHPRGYMALFLVEYAAEPISAQVVIAFGDTVFGKNGGWSGQYARLGPNYMLDWVTMQWAKSRGYRYYDLEGLQPEVAKSLLDDNVPPNPEIHGPDYYKLSFGGQVKRYSEAYDYVYNPVLRWGYTRIFPKIEPWALTKKMISRFR